LPFALGLVASIGCYLSAGATLGDYLGGVVLLALIAPALVAGRGSWLWAFARGGAAIDGIAAGWLLSLSGSITLVQWLCGYAILAAFGLALVGLVRALERLRIGGLGAAAIASTLALLWLSWPVWLATALRSEHGARLARWLVPAHPLFALNHVITQQGAWLEGQVIYGHVTLGQDVAYGLPESILPCIALHLVLAAGLSVLAVARSVDREAVESSPIVGR
jgi:hypothetical protein